MIDYVLWGDRMLASGKCDTFGKKMKWRRTRLNMTLKDLSRHVALRVFILNEIERDTESDEICLISINQIRATDARKMIDDALTLLEASKDEQAQPDSSD